MLSHHNFQLAQAQGGHTTARLSDAYMDVGARATQEAKAAAYMDADENPPWTTHMDVGSVRKRPERVGPGLRRVLQGYAHPERSNTK